VFFFFQAEDGIRDRNVTGVQTCALPISGLRHPHATNLVGGPALAGSSLRCLLLLRLPSRRPPSGLPFRVGLGGARQCRRPPPSRSEERRVGKEGSGRWWP